MGFCITLLVLPNYIKNQTNKNQCYISHASHLDIKKTQKTPFCQQSLGLQMVILKKLLTHS